MADNRGTMRSPERAFSIGFLTALVSDELVPCEAVLAEKGWRKVSTSLALEDAGITAWEKRIKGNKVRAYSMAFDDMGQTASAIETYAFLTRCNPAEIFLVGIAGSLRNEWVYRRDVVVGKRVICRTQNGVSGSGPCDEYRPHLQQLPAYDPEVMRTFSAKIARDYLNGSRDREGDEVVHTHFGTIYTWDYVIDSPRVVEKIVADFPDALCVEMEGGGFLRAIARYSKIHGDKNINGVIVRGISDYASNKEWNVPIRIDASRNAMNVAIDLAEWRAERYVTASSDD
ncbi:nucleoside phosphorylase [Sphingobium sp. OAS761]|uniref:5'-methylthioadenosine/S-adenosylhomocysteine nucleosidase family protein n=1 Tax=Sphingobium sp. OAS761 TaxID=2817901 RepID=UPI0020A0087E|nr:hypothetical protein [Sphingobium sp. OAS761]MCP1469866.1 nucleoside phosphorylase [Sphingobium sp. OAS761]